MSANDIRAALWEALIERAETLHHDAVLGQRRTSIRISARLERLANEVLVLSRAINLLGGRVKP